MAPRSHTYQESIYDKGKYENDGQIKHRNVIKNETVDSIKVNKNLTNKRQSNLKVNCTNGDYSNYFKEIQNNTPSMAKYAQYVPRSIYNFPITFNDWNPMITLPTPVYPTNVQQVPFVAINPPTINPAIVPSLCPCGTVLTEPIIPGVPPAVASKPVLILESYYEPLVNYIPEAVTSLCNDNDTSNNESLEDIIVEKFTPSKPTISDGSEELSEFYLRLPKELFPTARMFTINPNQIIDVFCDEEDISDHTPWLLDLEFGLPRVAVTRHIPVYDVQFNSIHCKNTPRAIHPGFERCSERFKREFLFYYDCIVSTWYKGFVAMKYDTSVKNFQTWLLQAMQIFGMCWP